MKRRECLGVLGRAVLAGAVLGGTALAWSRAACAQQPTMPADTLAAQVRLQGHRCEEPLSATRDAALSMPNEAVWVLKCANASYRLHLIPNMAARVERLE